MFRWEEQIWLLGLWGLIPIALVGLGGLYLNSRMRKRIGSDKGLSRIFTGRITWIPALHLWISVIIAALLFIAMANPQWGTKKGPMKVSAADAFILLDISQSMLVEDMAPNRLSRAKKSALDLVEMLKGDRIGLILFAGNAWLQMPLTNDYAAAALFIQSADPSIAPTQGTSIGEAMALAMESFEPESDRFRSLYVISDGEDHDEETINTIRQISESGIPVHCLGIGTEEGSFIPVKINNRADYKRDESGNFIRSSFQPEFLQDLASATGGSFYALNRNPGWQEDLRSSIEKLERREVEQRSFTDFESYYTIFAGLAILLVLIRLIAPETKKLRPYEV